MSSPRSEPPLAAVQGCAIGLVVAAILWALLFAGIAWLVYELGQRIASG